MKKVLFTLLFVSFCLQGYSQFFMEKTGKKMKKGITKFTGYYTFYYDENSSFIGK